MIITTCKRSETHAICVAAGFLIAISMITVPGCSDQKQQAEALVRTAVQHHEADRDLDALQLLNRAIALNPGLAEAFYLRGTCYSELHKPQNAVEDLSAATRLNPDWDEAWCALGIAQMTSGQTELGIASLTKALQLNAQMLPAWKARAGGYRDLSRTEDELLDLNRLLQLDSVNVDALLRRGTLLSETNPDQAIADLSNVISRNRENATAWMQRGLCYKRSGDTDRALADLNIACRMRADDFRPWLERGRILRALKRSGDAISDLSKAVELAPNETGTRLELSRAYADNGNLDAAEANLLQVQQLAPDDGEFRMAMAQFDVVQGHSSAAEERLRDLLIDEASLSPSLRAAARICLAQLLRETGETDEALSYIEQVLATVPDDGAALGIRADLLAHSNRREEAIQDYTRLISAKSSQKSAVSGQSLLERGRLLLDGQDWSAATADFSAYLEDHADDSDALALRAGALLKLDDAAGAIADLTRALLKKPDSAELYQLRAEAFDEFHEPAAALADLQKAARLHPEDPSLLQQVAERLLQDRQFAKAAITLDTLEAVSANGLSASQRLLRGRARLADGNLNGAWEDAGAISADETDAADSVTSEDVHLLQAMIALRRHDDAEALRLLAGVPEESLTPDLLLSYGQALARQGQTDEAIRVFSNLLKSDSSNMAALRSRASVYLDTADWQAALSDADQVLQTTPDDPRALQIRGLSLFRNDLFREALETLENPVLLSRDTADARWMRIQCCNALKLPFREMEELNALLGIAPAHESARLLRARLLEQLGHFDDAIADLSAALKENPVNLTALTSRAMLRQRRGDAGAAIDDFTKAIELSANDAELYYRRGIARHQTGHSDDARHDLDYAIELDSHFADAWYVIGNIEAGRGQFEPALSAYAKAVEIQPEHAAAWYNRGNLLFNQSRIQQAVDCWTIAITIQPELFRAYNNRAAAYSRMGRDAEAAADYEKTLELNPGFVRAWDNLAWLLATSDNQKVRDPERAVKLATKACEYSEFKDWTCLNTLATCCSESQDYAAAVKWAKQARELAPPDEHSELDQVVDAYERRLNSKRIAEKSGGSIR